MFTKATLENIAVYSLFVWKCQVNVDTCSYPLLLSIYPDITKGNIYYCRHFPHYSVCQRVCKQCTLLPLIPRLTVRPNTSQNYELKGRVPLNCGKIIHWRECVTLVVTFLHRYKTIIAHLHPSALSSRANKCVHVTDTVA